MKLRFIFNPKAGNSSKNARLLAKLMALPKSEAMSMEVLRTEGPGHATELAQEAVARGTEVVAAVGGDGTINEVSKGLLGSNSALALVPCGSGNGLALHLGVPTSPRRAIALALDPSAQTRAIDVGTVNGRPFFNVIGLGLDAEVSRRFAGLSKRGLTGYARETWSALRSHCPETVMVRGGGPPESMQVSLLAIANSDQWGNNVRIAPGARIDDGQLDLVAVAPFGLLQLPVLGWRLFSGSMGRSPLVSRRTDAHFLLERSSSGWIHVDGEPFQEASRLEIRIRPASLRVIVPYGATRTSQQS